MNGRGDGWDQDGWSPDDDDWQDEEGGAEEGGAEEGGAAEPQTGLLDRVRAQAGVLAPLAAIVVGVAVLWLVASWLRSDDGQDQQPPVAVGSPAPSASPSASPSGGGMGWAPFDPAAERAADVPLSGMAADLAAIPRTQDLPLDGFSTSAFGTWAAVTPETGWEGANPACGANWATVHRDAVVPAWTNYDTCKIEAGPGWVDPYGAPGAPAGETYAGADFNGRLAVDHVVGLQEAWVSGMSLATAEDRSRLYNDAAGLLVADKDAIAAKGPSDPSRWTPPSGWTCQYTARWLHVKAAYGMTADALEHDALAKTVSRCSGGASAQDGTSSTATRG